MIYFATFIGFFFKVSLPMTKPLHGEIAREEDFNY